MSQENGNAAVLPVVWASAALAFILWYGAFYPGWGNFWVKISFSGGVLGLTALVFGDSPKNWKKWRVSELAWGLALAAALYVIFWAGNRVSLVIFPFAAEQVEGIYGQAAGAPVWMSGLLIVFVLGPAEEIYWRGFVQQKLGERFGPGRGYAMATLLYCLIHVSTGNFMLVGAAGVAGAFWGAWYWKTGRLVPLIVSHSLWSVGVFALFPIQ